MKHIFLVSTLLAVTAACHHDKQAPIQPTGGADMTGQGSDDPEMAVPTVSGIDIDPKLAELCAIPRTRFFFKYDSATVRPEAKETLDLVATCVTTGPGAGQNLRIVGRTDPRGTVTYNQQLGENRASAVSAYLQGEGVPATQIDTISEGESEADENPMHWPYDRRVSIRLRS